MYTTSALYMGDIYINLDWDQWGGTKFQERKRITIMIGAIKNVKRATYMYLHFPIAALDKRGFNIY